MKRATLGIPNSDTTKRISIHALVKRATVTPEPTLASGQISIHALVKRATRHSVKGFHFGLYFNPRPREEGDAEADKRRNITYHFNPRPREEGDAF